MLQQMLRNPEMRRMMFSPEMMRMQLNMQRSMNGNGSGSAMAAPGTTDNTPQPGSTTNRDGATDTPSQQDPAAAASPFGPFGGAGAGTNANPFASLFAGGANPFAPQAQGQGNTNTAGTDSTQNNQNASAPPNPFGNLFGGAEGGQPNPIADAARNIMQNPQAMQQMMQMMGGGAGANPFGGFGGSPTAGAGAGAGAGETGSQQANPFAALFGPGFGAGGFGGPPAPADNRPPEEVYEAQLRQLNEMGFYEFDRNVSALRRSGGNVQGAIEYLLSGGS